MTQLIIDTGAAPNDGTGDPLRTAFTKVNYDFTAVYDAGPVGSNIQITDNRIITINTNGNLVLAPNGIGNVVSNVNILPNMSNIRSLGSSAYRWDSTYTRYLDAGSANITSVNIGNANIGNISTITIDVANIHILGGTNGYVLQTDGTGNLTWTAQTGGSGNGTPGGANTQIQYNDAGTFGGTVGFTFDNTSNTLSAVKINTTDVFNSNGIVLENSDLTQGATAAVVIPTNGSSDPIQVNNTYGNIALQTGAGSGITASWSFDNTGNLTFPDNSGSSWPVNTQRFGMGNIGAWLDGQWTIGEFSGNGVSGEFGIRIDPSIEGSVGMTFPSNGTSNTQPVQIYSTNGSGIELYTGSGGTWTFDSTGNLTLPDVANASINYSNGVNILNDITTTGNFAFNSYSFDGTDFDEIALTGTNSGNILVNADGLVAVLGGYESSGMIADAGNAYIFNSDPTFVDGIPQLGVGYIWQFDNGANLILAPTNQEINGAGSGESAKFRGTRKIVNGYTNSYAYSTVLAAGGTPTVAYTATDNSVMSVKVTFAVEGANGVWEQFDVSAVIDSTGNDVNFTVSNRVKRDLAIADTVVTATMDGSDRITISLNLDASQSAGWSSFDAVEFGLMVG